MKIVKLLNLIFLSLFFFSVPFKSDAVTVKNLSGEWSVYGKNISGKVQLPGTLAEAKLGAHFTAEDWLKDNDRRSKGALTREYQYRGKVVYERAFTLTEEEAKYPLELVLERVMLHSEVEIDGENIGSFDSLSVPHVYAVPRRLVKPGRHTIRLLLDNSNRYNFSEWAHSYGPVMQSVWHGVVGKLLLRRQNPLRQARIFASWPANKRFEIELPDDNIISASNLVFSSWKKCGKEKGKDCSKIFSIQDKGPSPYRKGFKLVEILLDRDPEPWSEYHPNLYVLTLRDGAADFTHRVRFGFRSVSAHDNAIWINGHKWFMRGNLDCCHFPLTGAPDTTKQWWRETFRRLRDEDGINTVRFHSWTPPKAAFDAADELGMLIAVEVGIWVDGWHRTQKNCDFIGYGKKIDDFVKRELRAVLEEYGNSPSFISLGIGNELGSCNFKAMGNWLKTCKGFDNTRLYIASTARSISPADDYYTTFKYPGVGYVRGRLYPRTDWDYEDVYKRTKLPVVAHEIGQWPIYVDWNDELPRYTGVLRPYNLEHYANIARKKGTEKYWAKWSEASARLNRLMYKDEVESFMRTPSCAGLQLLGAQDFTGQFEAMIGWRDSFYNIKPSVRTLPSFKRVFNSLPHLARFKKYIWTVGETYKAELLLRNITEECIPAGTEFKYSFASGDLEYSSHVLRLSKDIAPGEVASVGAASIPLTPKTAGKKLVLKFGTNSWSFWVFDEVSNLPSHPEDTAVVETASFREAVKVLSEGGRVFYTGLSAKSAKSKFKPVYWSTGLFQNANADLTTLGYCIRDTHLALKDFPTENWADWQWYNLVEGGVNHDISDLPKDCEPIIMPVPDLHYSTRMGMLFELKVGGGKLMVCGLNLSNDKNPETHAVKQSVLSYMKSDLFNPTVSLEPNEFQKIFAPRLPVEKKRPEKFAQASVYIAAAAKLDIPEKNIAWKSSFDHVEMSQGSYTVSGKDGFGVWCDKTGAFWHGRNFTVTLTGIKSVNGTLYVRFRDPNRKNRSGKVVCEGHSFVIPEHQNQKDGIYWAKLPIIREDTLDGKIEFSCVTSSGPNLMIDRVILMEE